MDKLVRRRGERGLAGLLIGLLCVLWPLSSWHQLTTLHEVCSEHGEVLDVAHSGSQEADEGPLVVDPEENGSHDECPFAPLAQPADEESFFVATSSTPVANRLEAVQVEWVREPAIPRYRLAPKQSPPSGRLD